MPSSDSFVHVLMEEGGHMASMLLLVVVVVLFLREKLQNDQLQQRIRVFEKNQHHNSKQPPTTKQPNGRLPSQPQQTQQEQQLQKQVAALKLKADRDRKQHAHELQQALKRQLQETKREHEKELKKTVAEKDKQMAVLQSKLDKEQSLYETKLQQALAKQIQQTSKEHEKELKEMRAQWKEKAKQVSALQSKVDKAQNQYEQREAKQHEAFSKQLQQMKREHETQVKELEAQLKAKAKHIAALESKVDKDRRNQNNGVQQQQAFLLKQLQQTISVHETQIMEQRVQLKEKDAMISALESKSNTDREQYEQSLSRQQQLWKEHQEKEMEQLQTQARQHEMELEAAWKHREVELLSKIVELQSQAEADRKRIYESEIQQARTKQEGEGEVFGTPMNSSEFTVSTSKKKKKNRTNRKKDPLKKSGAQVESSQQAGDKTSFHAPRGSRDELNGSGSALIKDTKEEEERNKPNHKEEEKVELKKNGAHVESSQQAGNLKDSFHTPHGSRDELNGNTTAIIEDTKKEERKELMEKINKLEAQMEAGRNHQRKEDFVRAHEKEQEGFVTPSSSREQLHGSTGRASEKKQRVSFSMEKVSESVGRGHVRSDSMGSDVFMTPLGSREINCPLGLMFDVMPPTVPSFLEEENAESNVTELPKARVGSEKKDNIPVQENGGQLSNVKHLRDNDVIVHSENGNDVSNYPGNKRYQHIVNCRKGDYADSQALDKPLVALEVIEGWRNQAPPGRFMERDADSGLWCDVGDRTALVMTSQMLRETTPSRTDGQCRGDSKSKDTNGQKGNASSMKRVEAWESTDTVAVAGLDDPTFRKTSTIANDPLAAHGAPEQTKNGARSASLWVPKKNSKVLHCRSSQSDRPNVKQLLKRLKDMTVEELFCEETVSDDDVVSICRVLKDKRCVLCSLTLQDCGLTVSAATALADVLGTNETIKTLDISHNLLGPDGLAVLVEPLATQNQTLTRLVLQDNKLTSKCASSIGYLLRANSTITDLFLGGSNLVGQYHFGPKGVKTMAPDLLKNTTLRTLSLSHNKLGFKGAGTIASKVLQANNTITSLDLACNNIGHKGTDSLATVLLHDKTVYRLNLESNNFATLGANSLVCVFRYNCTLTWLKLGNNSIGDVGAIAIAEGLSHNVSIVMLTLDWNGIGNAGVEAIAACLRKNTTLKTLDMSSNMIGTAGAIAMADSLPYNVALSDLNVTDNQIGDDGARAFGDLMASDSGCFLKTLHCNENNLSDDCIEWMQHVMKCRECDVEVNPSLAPPPPAPAPEEPATSVLFPSSPPKVVVPVMSDQPTAPWLTRLIKDVEGNRIVNIDLTSKVIGDAVLIQITSILLDNRSVRSLYMNGENITSQGMTAFAVCLAGNSTLERLYIKGCQMEGPGLDAVVKALGQNLSLKSLSLVSCGITSDTSESIASMLRVNNRLTRLNLSHNVILDDGLEKITDALRTSDAKLESLAVASNGITDLGLPHLDLLPLLTELRLDENRITDEGVRQLANCNNGHCLIKWLSLTGNEITKEGKAKLKCIMPEQATLIC